MTAGIAILGSTGSIGVSTLDVIARHPERFRVVALTANTRVEELATQCERFQPSYAVMADADAATQLRHRLVDSAPDVEVLSGNDALEHIAGLPGVEQVVAAIVGAAGLLPTLAAANAGKRVLLANKEALVMSGALFMDAVRRNDATLLPIDSEHNAIFQCLPDGYTAGETPHGVRRVLLTASGGPFRTMPVEQLQQVTPRQACAHPNWDMGRKISVDSATMMNKGLEVIEAGWLFGLEADRVGVVIHPQSLVHSLVEFEDGSMLAQMGNPDMRIPISHALGWPDRIASGDNGLDLLQQGTLEFELPDTERFPCLQLASWALERGGTAPAILNAANEIAVDAFLQHKIPFTDIHHVISDTLDACTVHSADTLQEILDDDASARNMASALVTRKKVVIAQ